MPIRTIVTSSILAALVATGGWLGYQRGFGVSLNARPAPLASPYTTEEAWIVNEIVSDITELSAYPAPPARIAVAERADRRGVYTVSADGLPPIEIDVSGQLWSPRAFSHIVTAPLESGAAWRTDVHPSLLNMTADALVDTAHDISASLRERMRDAHAHEAAAMVLAAFALRESAGRATDTRWALNRMTAHLAFAEAMQPSGPHSLDGRLATAVLLTLTGQQRAAMQLLDSIGVNQGRDAARWVKAIRLRITDDWRTVTDLDAASRVELRELFRARRATIGLQQTAAELRLIGERPDIDWIRIIEHVGVGVADGHLIDQAFDGEQAEYRAVFERMHHRRMDGDELNLLNASATRCVTADGVEVLPWGAWAEFAQRHLAIAIGRSDSYHRLTRGDPAFADALKPQLHAQWGRLWAFPTATASWTRGRDGKEADTMYLAAAIDELLARPYRVTAKSWSFIELGTHYEPLRRGVPPAKGWYLAPAPRTAYDVANRIADTGHSTQNRTLEALLAEAPFNYSLAEILFRQKYGTHAPVDDILRLAGERINYDVRPADDVLSLLSRDDQRRFPLLERQCGFSPGYCISWGYELARAGREQEAVSAYERALYERTLDPVVVANSSRWLVNYYASHNQVRRAIELAERVADTRAFDGLVTLGHLRERFNQMSDATAAFRLAGDTYDNYSEWTGFLYRRVVLNSDPNYAEAWRAMLARLFPDGLRKDAVSTDKPARGVHVASDSQDSRNLGLRAGDIIVAVDGWRVENEPQYRAVRAFPESGSITLTVWRGPGLVTVVIPDRRFVPLFTIENYPVKGWVE